MDNEFFTFIKPYLSYIDKGNLYRIPFSWLYTLMAILNLLVPFYCLYMAIDRHVYNAPAKFVFLGLFVWLLVAFAGWVSFQLWWDRRLKVSTSSIEGDDFVATPVFSHFIQTMGEWLGSWIAIVGCGVAILTTLILRNEGNFIIREMGLPDFLIGGMTSIIAMPLLGFLIIVFSRFLAEQFRALSSIANNTRKNH